MNMEKSSDRNMKHMLIPIIWHIAYLVTVGAGIFNRTERIYCDCIFYLVLSTYFLTIKSVSIRQWFQEWTKGRKFWMSVACTLIGLVAAYGVGMGISMLISGADDGMTVFKVIDVPSLIAFAATTILLPPVAEEAFYRKGLICFDSKSSLMVTSVIGIILFASEHSMKPLGLLISAIWAVPLTLSFVKTKNVYVPMTAHFICNLLFNGTTVALCVMRMLA